jgi:hypothetical protein
MFEIIRPNYFTLQFLNIYFFLQPIQYSGELRGPHTRSRGDVLKLRHIPHTAPGVPQGTYQ